jgi:hypothetical protein
LPAAHAGSDIHVNTTLKTWPVVELTSRPLRTRKGHSGVGSTVPHKSAERKVKVGSNRSAPMPFPVSTAR